MTSARQRPLSPALHVQILMCHRASEQFDSLRRGEPATGLVDSSNEMIHLTWGVQGTNQLLLHLSQELCIALNELGINPAQRQSKDSPALRDYLHAKEVSP